jgi:microcystin degradation protein MlrC
MSLRVALLGIYHESNTFVQKPTAMEDFKSDHFLLGDDIRKEYQDAHHEIGGMMQVMDKEGIEVLPIIMAIATPGGTVTAEAYNELLAIGLNGLEKLLPVDAVLVAPHGAGVSADFPDMDGHWLSKVREKVGNQIPIVGTLDLHANVSPLMVSSTNALVSYKKNPHVDMRQRGIEAAEILVDLLKGKTNPKQVLVQVPLAISIEQQLTLVCLR